MPEKRPHVRAVPWRTPTEEKVRGALGEIPAYIRRAKRVEMETARLFAEAGEARAGLLGFVCLRLRQVIDLLDDEAAETLTPETLEALGRILDQVETIEAFLAIRARPRSSSGSRALPRALEALRESVRRFNAKWAAWLSQEAPLAEVNAAIEGYNEHYAFERQCAVRYIPLDKLRFEKKPLLTEEDVLARLPYLPEPSQARQT